ncbi:MAG TPA: phage tail sheath C-terminal domain-containing protein [Thermoanaerobaculia bacterium]|nr:phage tail sheath C-terminal domain-containing protein [Thermoanaerobaculia bacterium]
MSVDAAFPSSISGVATAVPAFIGYTAKAAIDDRPVYLQPIPIDSLSAFEQIFGTTSRGPLHDSIALFYANGGAACVVVAVAPDSETISAAGLLGGLRVIGERHGVTMLVVPDAVLLPSIADFGTVAQAMLMQAGTLGDRFAILDVYGGATVTAESLSSVIDAFRNAVGQEFLSYGAAYFPFLLATDGTTVSPPSAAMAGIYTALDATNGVWSAPANVAVQGISRLTYALKESEQEDLNVPIDGKAVDALRAFATGNLVWGARTLDGNSNDYRYIQVRRTLIYIEQSIKNALDQFVFAPNTSVTWATVTAAISSFLTSIWSQGGLLGATASDAFTVQCGLGSTMTGQDVLDGYMIVQVTLQLVRPAEFIVLMFQQQMAGAA